MLLLWMGSVYVALFFYVCGIHIRQYSWMNEMTTIQSGLRPSLEAYIQVERI